MAKTFPVPTLLSVTVFVRNGSDILLMKRGAHRAHEPNKFCGVGGKVDAGETIFATAMRETREETGLDLPPNAFTFRGNLILDGYPDARWVVSLFEAWTDEREIIQTDEGVLRWIPASEVLETDLMDDIRLYFPQFLASSQPIFGHFQFDANNRVIEHTLHQAPQTVLSF